MVVLDHHKTSAAELTDPSTLGIGNLEVHFDMERSGATVAADYFQLEVGVGFFSVGWDGLWVACV